MHTKHSHLLKKYPFRKKKPRENMCVIRFFSKEAKEFEGFINKNKHKKVYLNIEFEGSEFEINEDGDSRWLVVWTDTFQEVPKGEKLDTSNCNGYQLTIIPHEDGFGNFHWFRGAYQLSGHFYIDGYSGPYQGLMSAVISAAKTI
ncbi:hypothetical protein [Klebsiella sp. M621]|uniref:hypothetical protein n=1 Tax=Klebsiella sp. M621 TaxID=2870760 RepID=UPI001C8E8D0A|nr:hypothetical protein [Klebsiella sp. M621]MBY0693043.1 hypothetical protein [Klebsiella sp. M621]